jgi:hypothetical protein
MKKSIWRSLAEAPGAMVKGSYNVAKDIYQIGKRIVNPPLTPMQRKQMDSFNSYRERHKYDPEK